MFPAPLRRAGRWRAAGVCGILHNYKNNRHDRIRGQILSGTKRAGLGLFGGLLILAAGIGHSGPAWAQDGPPRVERELGEEEQIRAAPRVVLLQPPRRDNLEPTSGRPCGSRAWTRRGRPSSGRRRGARPAWRTATTSGSPRARRPRPSAAGPSATSPGGSRRSPADWAGEVLYLGTASGGLWKSTNDGLTWTQLFDSAGTMTIGTVAVDPNDPDVIWVGTGENNQSLRVLLRHRPAAQRRRRRDLGAAQRRRRQHAGGPGQLRQRRSSIRATPNAIVTGGRHPRLRRRQLGLGRHLHLDRRRAELDQAS